MLLVSTDLSNRTHSDICSALSPRVILKNSPHLCGNPLALSDPPSVTNPTARSVKINSQLKINLQGKT